MDLEDDIFNCLNSKEVRKELKISSCDLAHMRIERKLKYKKVGNAFLYTKESVEKLKLVILQH
jgi:hypothetical protein